MLIGAGDKSGRVSISGFVWSYGGPISWSAKKQNCVALSSTGPSNPHFLVFSTAFLPPLLHFSPISAVFVRFSSLTFPRSPVLPRFRNLKMRRSLLGCEDLCIYSRQTPSRKPCAHSFYYICIIQCRPRHHHFLVTIFSCVPCHHIHSHRLSLLSRSCNIPSTSFISWS